jgi:nitrite reductase/ring-hydroxylating ferredoxin subunit
MREPNAGTALEAGPSPSRRAFLAAVCGAAAGAAGLSGAGCSRRPAIPDDVLAAIPLASLPPGQRTVLPVHERPVEFLRTGKEITARSLDCTHLGCEVAWVEAERRYRCPCHEGTFDEEGRVVAGPPPRPLKTYSVTVQGELALVRA